MLVLGRKENESIIIGDNIRVTIVGRSGSSIRLGVQAPNDVRVVREELTRRQGEPSRAVSAESTVDADASAPSGEDAELDEGPSSVSHSKVVVGELPTFTMPPQAAG